MNNKFQQRAKIRRTAASVIIVIIVAAIIFIDHMKSDSLAAATTTPSPTPSTESTATPAPTATPDSVATTAPTSVATPKPASPYKDGTYTAQSRYSVPQSYETIQVSITIKNGIVTATHVNNSQGDRTSAEYQQQFAAEYTSSVVGKSLSSLNLNIVAGASDTTLAFDRALDSIRTQARA